MYLTAAVFLVVVENERAHGAFASASVFVYAHVLVFLSARLGLVRVAQILVAVLLVRVCLGRNGRRDRVVLVYFVTFVFSGLRRLHVNTLADLFQLGDAHELLKQLN